MRTVVVIISSIIFQTLGDVCLTRGMKAIGEVSTLNPRELFQIGVQVFTSPWVWLGISLLAIFYLLYLIALSWADLSYVIPVSAFGYVLNAILAKTLLGEQISLTRWIGTTIICFGVMIVSRTEQRTTHQPEMPADMQKSEASAS
jgi:drug/metabolite transporter (DMT)-like permease